MGKTNEKMRSELQVSREEFREVANWVVGAEVDRHVIEVGIGWQCNCYYYCYEVSKFSCGAVIFIAIATLIIWSWC